MRVAARTGVTFRIARDETAAESDSHSVSVEVAATFDRTHTEPRHALAACVAAEILHGTGRGRADRHATIGWNGLSDAPSALAPHLGGAREREPERAPDGWVAQDHRRADRGGRQFCHRVIWVMKS
jgi:hypothetical protein